MIQCRVRGRHGFTLIELLVVIAIISIIAGFLVPTLLKGRGEAYKVQCANNLKQVFGYAQPYKDKTGSNAFPIGQGSEPAAHESLTRLVEYSRGELPPKAWFCPEGEAIVAEVDEDDQYILEEENSSYTWAKKRKKKTSRGALSSDKYIQGYEDDDGPHDGHKNGMNVLRTDGSISFVDENDLPDENDGLPKGLTR
jgi:prepilin-type N-terminal cleavage/methylation domain-containing protein